MSTPSDEMVVARQFAEALIRFPPDHQERILKWTRENLRVLASSGRKLSPIAPLIPRMPVPPQSTATVGAPQRGDTKPLAGQKKPARNTVPIQTMSRAKSLAAVARVVAQPVPMAAGQGQAPTPAAAALKPLRPVPLSIQSPLDQAEIKAKSNTDRIPLLATPQWIPSRQATDRLPSPPTSESAQIPITPPPPPEPAKITAQFVPAPIPAKSDTRRIPLLATVTWMPTQLPPASVAGQATTVSIQTPSDPAPTESRRAMARIVSRPIIVRMSSRPAIVRMASRPAAPTVAPRSTLAWIASQRTTEWIASKLAEAWIASREAAARITSRLATAWIISRQATARIGSTKAAAWIQSASDTKLEKIINVDVLKHILVLGAALGVIYLTQWALEYFK